MIVSTEFLIYVALYRLTVLTVGALSIYLGFRLFTRLGEEQQSRTGTTLLDTKIWTIRFSTTNFWPGVFLVLFGTGLIGVMLWQGAPQLTLEDIQEATVQGAVEHKDVEAKDNAMLNLGLCTEHVLPPEVQERLNQELVKLKQPGMTLEAAAEHLGHIARIWHMQGRGIEALAMARLAYLYGPAKDRATNLALYAELLVVNGRELEAVEAHKDLVNMESEAPEEAE